MTAKAGKRRTLQQRADSFADWDCEYLEYDAEGWRRVHQTEDWAASSGDWLAGYRAARRQYNSFKK